MRTLILVPTAAGCPRAPELVQGPAAIAPRLDLPPSSLVAWLETEHLPVERVAAEVAAATERVAAAGLVPIVVGGDHTVALGGVAGMVRALRGQPLHLLWLDAHPDVNTPETSPSGNAHGMVLRGLLGGGPFAIDSPLPPERVVLAGVRSFDPGELAFLQSAPLEIWDVARLRGEGWRRPLATLLRRVARQGGRLYVSLDLDVVDPALAPGVAAPAAHGAFPEPLLALLHAIVRSGRLAGADVVELHPLADDGRTAALAAQAAGVLMSMHAARAHRHSAQPARAA